MDILGFSISKAKKFGLETQQNEPLIPSFVAPDNDGVGAVINGGGLYGAFVDFEGTAKSEIELISRYREAAQYPDCDNAIEDICNEAIGADDDEDPVKITLDDVELSKSVKLKLEAAFEEIKELLNYQSQAHDIFKRWYIDGRLYYHKLVDPKRPSDGIQELRYIDPRKIRKIRDVQKKKDPKTGVDIVTSVNEYFIYTEQSLTKPSTFTGGQYTSKGLKIDPEAIAYVNSGIVDYDRNMVLGHLNKAVKPINMLKLAEDSMLIWRLSRAPSRRVFYVDTGNLPKQKAEQYLKDVMNRYRNKIIYDASTGEMKDDRKHMSMLEDYWLPRREGGQGTEIQNLDGLDNTNQKEDTEYFLQRVYTAMNVPLSRLQQDATFNFGRQAEITQDELKFAKFIARLRRKFSDLFNDLMRTQVVLTGICSVDDWETIIQPKVKYTFAQDIYWKEAKDLENLRNRIDIVNEMEPLVGIYFSQEYVKKEILKQTDDDIKLMQKQMDNEKELRLANAEFQGQLDGTTQAANMEIAGEQQPQK